MVAQDEMDDFTERESSIDDRPSIRVVNAIAEHEETTPTEIRPVLYDIIDPDALDSLFSETQLGNPRSDGHVSFEYDGHEVTVYSDSKIEIEPLQGDSTESPESIGSVESFSSSSESTSNDN
ncbi:HalOD1 output domain-containing protein [Haladaptatus pallidirubidus]|uniref:Halobacterial output domain-containing protein n=1 Tax=Haladaptatus pallidirubidus TaxID=1008152 RepID=A0AAV3UBX9_9EURY|nr:HalOD1 output domain-containing protein [Haladaptatus pallidirubidus]